MRLKINAEVEQSSYQKYLEASQCVLRQFDRWNSKFGYADVDFEVGFVPVILKPEHMGFSSTASDRWSFIDKQLFVGEVIDSERFKNASKK